MTRLILLCALAGLTTGCSSFEERYEEALHATRTNPHDMTGPWRGTWTSSVSGHTGELRAIVRRLDDGKVRVDYWATYELVWCDVSFEYGLEMRVFEADGGALGFEGQADLGWLAGGVYTYEGESDGRRYESTYTSEADHGVFVMRRP